MNTSIPIVRLIQYGLIAFPLAFAGLPIYLHAPDFYAVNLGLRIEAIGAVLLILRLFDAVQDPVIGRLSDRFHAQRRGIILFGVLLLVGGFWMIFHPLTDYPLAWLALSVLVCTTGFSVVTINVQALGGLWQVPNHEVARVMGAREALGLFGLLVASIVPPVLLMFYDYETTYHGLALALLPLMALGVFALMRWMNFAHLTPPQSEFELSTGRILSGSQTRLFLLSYLLGAIASSIPATLILFYVRDYLQAESYLGLFLVIYFVSGAAAMPLWNECAKRFSTLMSWWLSMVLACATFVWALTLQPGDVVGYALVCMISGVSVGANLALPSAIAAHIIAEKQHQSAASRYYAVMALLSKAALALATGLALPLLGWAGYQPGEPSSGWLMPTAYALMPCLVQMLAIGVLWRLILQTKHR